MLLVHNHRAAHGLKNPLCQFHCLVADKPSAAERRRARAQRRGSVRHRPHYWNLDPGRFFNRTRLHRRRKRNQRLGRRQRRLDLSNNVGNLERLHADQDQIRLADCREVVRAHVHAPLRAQRQRSLGMVHRCVNPVRRKQVLFQERLQQDAAHLACAQHSHAQVGQLCRYFGGLYGDLCHGLVSRLRHSCRSNQFSVH